MRTVLSDISFANCSSTPIPQDLEKQLQNMLSRHQRVWNGRVILFDKNALTLVLYNVYTSKIEFTFNHDFEKLPAVTRRPRYSAPYYACQLLDGLFMVAIQLKYLIEFTSSGAEVHRYEFCNVVAIFELENKFLTICHEGGVTILCRETKDVVHHNDIPGLQHTIKLSDGTFITATSGSDLVQWDSNFSNKLLVARLNTGGGICEYSPNVLVRTTHGEAVDLYSLEKDDTTLLFKHKDYVSRVIPMAKEVFMYLTGSHCTFEIYNQGVIYKLQESILYDYKQNIQKVATDKVAFTHQDKLLVYNSVGKKEEFTLSMNSFCLLLAVMEVSSRFHVSL
jgi:hypothetical protein